MRIMREGHVRLRPYPLQNYNYSAQFLHILLSLTVLTRREVAGSNARGTALVLITGAKERLAVILGALWQRFQIFLQFGQTIGATAG